MEENHSSSSLEGEISGIRFGLATGQEICMASNSDCPISHNSQLTNPFLGLPLDSGKCESCGTAEPGKCDGHFGYIDLPIPIYHPCHVSELRRMLSLLCLKCLRLKKNRFFIKSNGVSGRVFNDAPSCCEELSQISIKEGQNSDGAYYLELKLPSRSTLRDGFWNFLERYGFRYGGSHSRPFLPSEVMEILKRIPAETRKKLAGKGYFPQDGYILKYLPVPPNCLSIPDISDGIRVMSSDLSVTLLKKVLRQVEIIKSSRSGTPNFESLEVEANDLQSAVAHYLQVRGTAKASRDVEARFGISKEPNDSSTKAWLEKMRTLFIRKGSGFSSRSVITGDAFKGANEIGIPYEIAQRITFEEKVNMHNIKYLQKLVDDKLCLTYSDGLSTYSLREGSKGHTFLRPGQVVNRHIMDGDIVFINRPPTTHKHSLQAFSVYVHEDHTVKINPLICGPLSADFDGDCVHLFYPQSLAAKAEVVELFFVDKQLLSSHSGGLNLQFATDSLLSLKNMLMNYFLDKYAAQQLAMFVTTSLPAPALLKAHCSGPLWTALQILQTALPAYFDCYGERYLIIKSELLEVNINRDMMSSLINEIVTSIFFDKGPKEVLNFFNSLQPLLMENLFSEGFSVGLEDFSAPLTVLQNIHKDIQDISPLLYHLRSAYNELVELQFESHIRHMKVPVANFILKSSALGNLIDSNSDSAINKVVQQIGFLGLQLSDKGKFYSRILVEDMASLFRTKYPIEGVQYPSGEYGLVKNCFFHGLDPYEEMVHSIASREVLVRSSRGLSEPGTLFKNLMAILRDVVICYDGTVRNVCSNSVIQFDYGVNAGSKSQSLFPAGEPVGVLAATAMSNPAYKAVLDSSPSSNSSWELMKEILLCKASFKNDPIDRRVILYLNDCDCGRKYCRENAAYLVRNQLKRVSLKDTAVEFMIEYKKQQTISACPAIGAGLVGHVHLNKMILTELNISMLEILEKCQDTINSYRRKKKAAVLFKRIDLCTSECCSFQQSCESKWPDFPCLMFLLQDPSDSHLEITSRILSDIVLPVLLETIVKGDPRVCTVNIVWISPDATIWIGNPCTSQKGELALDVVLDKAAVRQSGDVWRIIMDSCLPVIHLIDTSRSIPYAIKQVQELLGISCTFEQAVQRLSTSVALVAKGVLKEHLILLANSMTCAGSLIGFNKGGYKTLSRSLNIQVPFTEATLFTPKKCFEMAAEKCHVDSLSSIVASCSWGKHVAVGTGSRFDIIWDKKEIGVMQEGGIDVYSFLHLVRSSTRREEPNTACLGAEVDDLMLDDEIFESGMSPEQGFDKPIFEETILSDEENIMPANRTSSESNWDTVSTLNAKSGGTGDWMVDKPPNQGPDSGISKSNAWSSWKTDKVQAEDDLPTKVEDYSSRDGGWRVNVPEKQDTQPEKSLGWGSVDVDRKKELSVKSWNSNHNGERESLSLQNSHDWDSSNAGGWGEAETAAKNEWGQPASSSGWGSGDIDNKKELPSRSWNANHNEIKDSSSMQSSHDPDSNNAGGWGQPASSSGWGSGVVDNRKELFVKSWSSNHNEKKETSSQQSSHDWDSSNAGGWDERETTAKNKWSQPASSSGWGSPFAGNGNEGDALSGWGQQEGVPLKRNQSENAHGWGSTAGNWKNKTAKSPMMSSDGSSVLGIYTTTRQRLDMFTTEEQDILSEVEPIMLSIRRIMRQASDGDPLSTNDKSYVLDNVFSHHPDKAAKMGVGIDSVMVNKHSTFQESRCFYIVSTDGCKKDFSYRKCLENFIKGKYPDLAESFIGKYFRKVRPGGNREQHVTKEGNVEENRQ